jgi:hypothetical protein
MGDRGPFVELPDSVLIEVYRAMSPDRRIEVGLDMTELVRARLAVHLTDTLGFEPDQVGVEIARRHRIAGG